MVIGGHNLKTRYCLSDLPEDLQVLLFDLVGISDDGKLLKELAEHCFAVHELPIDMFPDVSVWTDYRDRTYADAMVGQDLPPAIVCGEKWLDGRHRVWVWRRNGMKRVPCIDLAEIGFSYPLDGIASLDNSFVMRINSAKELQLATMRLDAGLPDFKSYLGKKIHLPPDKRQWPEPGMIRKANSYRRIAV